MKLDCGLGEAPFWDEAHNEFRFVDIEKQHFYTFDLNKGPSSLKRTELRDAVGTTADIEGSETEIITGAKYGYAKLNKQTGELEYVARFWDEKEGKEKEHRMRSNDGVVDNQGRYWVGAMNDPKVASITDEGVLFRLDPDLTLHRVIEKVTIPNGMSWNPAEDTMYFTDSPTKSIFAYDYDKATGNISNRRPFFTMEEDGLVPDGHCMDAEGYIWCAIYGGSRVIRISPEGKIVARINVPTRATTCPGFAGTQLFITTAKEQDPEKYPESKELAGSLFVVDVGVKGLPTHKFRFEK